MPSLLNTNLLFVTGKGGAGKTTVAAALGLVASRQGRRTIVCEMSEQQRIPQLLGRPVRPPGEEQELGPRLWGKSVNTQRTLAEWLPHQVGSRAVARLLLASDTFQYIAAAAPGSAEVVTMTALWELVQPQRWDRRARPYDLVVVDAPASGNFLGMLRTPATYDALVRAGPIARQARRLRALFEDPKRTAVVAVAQAAELAVTETLEVEDGLRRQLGRGLKAAIVNAMLPRRFSRREIETVVRATTGAGLAAQLGRDAAISIQRRSSEQHNQLNRLRRRLDAPMVTLPFVFTQAMDANALDQLARTLERRL
ncbi:MAG TPA: ArsA-related P-loop ATPase [Solirubrobacteraceae bacterium]|jgi:anion-transporting  ArsA/GET3 family ATPase|nr:ArsA-related P-loop ATPase [Solirubrobacteraceae bacterium]